MKRALIYLWSLPSDLVAWAIVLFVHLLWGHRLVRRHGVLATELHPTSWPSRTWYKNWGATTFGHGIMFNDGELEREDLWRHELVHVEQYESEALQNLGILAYFLVVGPWWAGLAWCALGGLLSMVSGFGTAFCRGEGPYTGSHLEEAARNAVSCRRKNVEPLPA